MHKPRNVKHLPYETFRRQCSVNLSYETNRALTHLASALGVSKSRLLHEGADLILLRHRLSEKGNDDE